MDMRTAEHHSGHHSGQHSGHHCDAVELVGGQASTPGGSLPPRLTDSDSGEELHGQLASTPAQVEAAIVVAARVHRDGVWTGLSDAERGEAVRCFAVAVSERVDRLAAADSLDTGVPMHWTAALAGGRAGLLTATADEIASGAGSGYGRTVIETDGGAAQQWRLPWGPAAVFLPWNAPAPTAITKIGDALAAGCPVVVKASEWAPHFSGPLAEAVAASLPPGMVQIVHGDRAVGEQLASDERIRAVSYTGGVAGGTAVATTCARQLKPVDLELSGHNPVLALPDADPAAVAAEVAFGVQFLNGQICVGPRRLVVPAEQLDEYLAALDAALDAVMIGTTRDPATTIGPMAHRGHRDHLAEQIAMFAHRGCEVRRYGRLPAGGGHFLQPAVVVADAAPELRSEVFGPVLTIRTYREVAEGVDVANDHAFGLVGYVFGADRERALKVGSRLRAGLVTVNAVLGGGVDAPAIGSMWGQSGLGTVGAGQGPAFLTGHRFVG